jgi:signal transduction histidine kinase
VVAGVRDGTPRVRDWTYLTADGTELRVQVAVTARRDAAGDPDGYLFVGTDVTRDREQARMKDEFVNLISHELRTPLSSILGYLELVIDDEDNPLTPEQLTYLGTVERNANRLLRLVSDLLFTAQVESGRFQLQEQPVDLQRCCPRRSTPPPRSPPDAVSRSALPPARTRSSSAATRSGSVRPWTT